MAKNKILKKKRIILSSVVFFIFLLPFAYSSQLKVTEEHPFLINGSWIKASELKQGDILKTFDGKQVIIKNITDIQTEEPFLVYNFEDDYALHNYVVENGLVVHNSVPGTVVRDGSSQFVTQTINLYDYPTFSLGNKIRYMSTWIKGRFTKQNLIEFIKTGNLVDTECTHKGVMLNIIYHDDGTTLSITLYHIDSKQNPNAGNGMKEIFDVIAESQEIAKALGRPSFTLYGSAFVNMDLKAVLKKRYGFREVTEADFMAGKIDPLFHMSQHDLDVQIARTFSATENLKENFVKRP